MSRERLLTDAMRRLFVVTTALVIIIAVQLFVLTEQTESYFAWTIAVPLSAAWLGAGYCSGIASCGCRRGSDSGVEPGSPCPQCSA
ncbi:MAG TPA: hypothetical protein VFF07_08830 [Actinomycetota bacterium]|nr:hypothetical protein [Actinomycetota bacterium]